MNHTPGPWNVQEGSANNKYCEIWSGLLCIGETSGCSEIRSEGEDAANARLIAAAPDLLKACIAIREEYVAPTKSALDIVYAAIAKATGDA